MCYSAQVEMDLKELASVEKVTVDLAAFEALFEARLTRAIEIPKGLESNFNLPRTPVERRIRELIETFNVQAKAEYLAEQEKYRVKLADAERRLAKKESASGLNDKRLAENGIKKCDRWLADLTRVERKDSDYRVWPMTYAPVVLLRNGERVLLPMRYLCRPEDQPRMLMSTRLKVPKLIPFEKEKQGCYNARRDNLKYFWKQDFGSQHAYWVIKSFFESVYVWKYEKREPQKGEEEKTIEVHYQPSDGKLMRVACLWSHNKEEDDFDLYSFAAVTDEPTPEVAETGHDRGLIPLNDPSIEVWLRPDKADLKPLYEAMDNRVMPFYEHRLAA